VAGARSRAVRPRPRGALVCGAAGFQQRTPPAPLPCVPTRSLSVICVPPRRRRCGCSKVQPREQGARVHTSCGVRGCSRRRPSHGSSAVTTTTRTHGRCGPRSRAARARARALGTRAARRWRAPPHGARAARRGPGRAAQTSFKRPGGLPRRAAAPSLRPRRGAAGPEVLPSTCRAGALAAGGRKRVLVCGGGRLLPAPAARGTPPDLRKKRSPLSCWFRARARRRARARARTALPTARSLALTSCLASSKVFLTHGRAHAWAALACQGDAVEATMSSAALDNCRHVSPRHTLPRHHTVPSST
jgi:hypothetical protein